MVVIELRFFVFFTHRFLFFLLLKFFSNVKSRKKGTKNVNKKKGTRNKVYQEKLYNEIETKIKIFLTQNELKILEKKNIYIYIYYILYNNNKPPANARP